MTPSAQRDFFFSPLERVSTPRESTSYPMIDLVSYVKSVNKQQTPA